MKIPAWRPVRATSLPNNEADSLSIPRPWRKRNPWQNVQSQAPQVKTTERMRSLPSHRPFKGEAALQFGPSQVLLRRSIFRPRDGSRCNNPKELPSPRELIQGQEYLHNFEDDDDHDEHSWPLGLRFTCNFLQFPTPTSYAALLAALERESLYFYYIQRTLLYP